MARTAAGCPMHDPADQSQFINELLDQQDAVISQLDQLLVRIEEVLKVAVISTGEELVDSQADEDASKKAA